MYIHVYVYIYIYIYTHTKTNIPDPRQSRPEAEGPRGGLFFGLIAVPKWKVESPHQKSCRAVWSIGKAIPQSPEG